MEDIVTDQTSFGIRLVDTPEGRNTASMLIHKMYAWRGLAGTHAILNDPNRVTLMAHRKGEAVGTLTIGLDSPSGILADQLFKPEIDAFRALGNRVCEITKLAFDIESSSKSYLAALFHLSVIVARDMHACDLIFIEISPRHRGFFQRMLGFRQLGEEKINPRVNVRGILMCVPLTYMTEQTRLFGGKGAEAVGERSLFPLFYSPREECGIVNRLKERR
ncbi:N-acetyltransferase [Massilia sp. CCM 8694]|uniref:N-acetyltransferase n=2 Tax=Massilia genomosp. 1 TaxID=2609280 RepID=A0ABX0MYD1_9BURK|nr:N-acetyltransferase [Massilia genomosp. 1]